jgi:hypothetical protein
MFSKLILFGNVGGDPEIHTNENTGITYVSFSVAVSIGKDEKRKTSWHRCSIKADTNTAKYCMEFVKKGDAVYIEGLPLPNGWINSEKQMISEVNCYINTLDHVSENIKPDSSPSVVTTPASVEATPHPEEETDPMDRLNSLPVAAE